MRTLKDASAILSLFHFYSTSFTGQERLVDMLVTSLHLQATKILGTLPSYSQSNNGMFPGSLKMQRCYGRSKISSFYAYHAVSLLFKNSPNVLPPQALFFSITNMCICIYKLFVAVGKPPSLRLGWRGEPGRSLSCWIWIKDLSFRRLKPHRLHSTLKPSSIISQ